jgi:type IV pilus assembly protein PilB
MAARRKLGEVLRARSEISAEDLDRAIAEQRAKSMHLGELLLERGIVPRASLISAIEEVTRVPYLDCTGTVPELDALKQVPRATAVKHCVFPLRLDRRRLVVVMAEPQDLAALDELRFQSGSDISPRLGFRQEILAAIDRHYGEAVPAEPSVLSDADVSELELISASANARNQAALSEFQAEMRGHSTPAVHVVSSILLSAAEKKASDIHIEQLPDDCVVRLRIDGVLREMMRVPDSIRAQLISRIKILSDMDIAERRVSQDGRFLIRTKGHNFDLRVSTLPTQYGEKVVIRLLDPAAANVPFCELGFSAETSSLLTEAVKRPQGMVLVTGPTGSGKSTTLYSALSLLRSPKVNIVTIEDPVEYVIDGINQVQVNAKAGRTFASCLRSLLRQDPNVIMVGEVRDGETVEIAMTAAQTGHMLLSSLHTNDAVSAITRLLDLGCPAFLIGSSLSAVIAQRLVRKMCLACKHTVPASPEYRARLMQLGMTRHVDEMVQARGCTECEGSGYKGRVGVYELLMLNDTLRVAIRSGLRDDELRVMARAAGMKLLQEDALDKVLAGITTLDEIQRVVPFISASSVACQMCAKPLAADFLFCPYCGVHVVKAGVAGTTPAH